MLYISCVTVSANGNLAVSSSRNRTVQKWDLSTCEAVGPPTEGGGEGSVAISGDGTPIVSGGFDGTVNDGMRRQGKLSRNLRTDTAVI